MRNPTGTRSWEREPDATRDRFVLATAGANVARLLEGAEAVLARLSHASELPPRDEAALSSVQRRVFDSLLALIGGHWRKHTGKDAAPADVLSILRLMRIVRIDPDTGVPATAVGVLRDTVVDRPAQAEAAWGELKLLCHELASRRASVDQLALRNALAEKGIDLRTVSHLSRDIQRLQEFTEETLASLEHLATIATPESPSRKGEAIERTATPVIVREARLGSFLVVGEPGAGKSGALYAAARQLQGEGTRTLVIAVDQHPVSTLSGLFRDIGIENPLVEILSGWAGQAPGVLIIDALDAARGGTSEAVFQRLIRDVLVKLPAWRVVASIREFDLRYGVVYRDLFAGRPVDQELRHPEFGGTRHLRISRLTDGELSQLWAKSPSLSAVFRRASSSLQNLLRSPFNLFLLSSILRARIEASVQDISTQVELLDKYWSYRVIDQDGQSASREAVLASVVDAMVVSRSLALEPSLSGRYESNEWRDLFSRGVLSALRARAEQIILFGFSHHMLFDYAVARLLLKSGQTADFSKILTQSDDLALLLSPGAILALRMLWEEDHNRRSFWQRSNELARADAVGSFCRMLPARVAADSTDSVNDWESLFASLRSGNDSEREAARFLVRHAIGALTIKSFPKSLLFGTSARPWTSILRRLIETDIEHLHRMIRPFLHEAVTSNELLTAEQCADIGVISRLLLDTAVADVDDTQGVALAIQGVAHTFSSDTSASARSLQSVLAPGRVATHGYADLFWLAGEVATLLSKGNAAAQTIADVYRAAFCSPLPPRDKETNLGGRILSLRSNQRQEFEGARHRLVQDYADFVARHPIAATGALLAAVEYYEKEERTSRGGMVSTFSLRGHSATYQQDWSVYWQNFNKNDAVALLEQYKRALPPLLKNQPSEADEIVEYAAAHNRLACVWAALLSVGAECPEPLGMLLVTLLSTQVVLEGPDTTKQAGDLMAAVFSSLDVEARNAIEAAVLKCKEHVQEVMLGCMPAESLVSEAAIARRAELESTEQLRPNVDQYRIEAGWTERGDKDWWLRGEGVDVDAEPNRTVNEKFRALEEATRGIRNNPDSSGHASLWQDALALADALESPAVKGEALVMGAWSAIADAADVVALQAKTSKELAAYPRILDLVFQCLLDSNWPLPIKDPGREKEFARGPSWSSPSPRVGGAQAIMAIARALGTTTPDMDALIRRLASDPRPEVRFQVLSRANMIFNASRDLMFEILGTGFSDEQNEGVVSGLLSAASRALGQRPSWFSERLFQLRERFPSKEEARDRIEPVWTQSIVILAVDYGDAAAERTLWAWAQDPSRFEEHALIVFSYFRSAITFGDVDGGSVRENKIRQFAIRFFFEAVTAATQLANESMAASVFTDESRTRLTAAVKVLDSAATEIYFGSGAYQENRAQQSRQESDGPIISKVIANRFLREFGPTLELLAQAPYPSITHHLLETLEAFIDVDPEFAFRVAMRALNDGGRRSGYRFESMGISLFDRIVRRYLADHRALIAKSPELRKELMAALDTFVETGWAEARELVYQLPEMLR